MCSCNGQTSLPDLRPICSLIIKTSEKNKCKDSEYNWKHVDWCTILPLEIKLKNIVLQGVDDDAMGLEGF